MPGAEGAMRKTFRQKDRIRTKLRKVRDDTEEAIPAGRIFQVSERGALRL